LPDRATFNGAGPSATPILELNIRNRASTGMVHAIVDFMNVLFLLV
jgi:hypothetical protein